MDRPSRPTTDPIPADERLPILVVTIGALLVIGGLIVALGDRTAHRVQLVQVTHRHQALVIGVGVADVWSNILQFLAPASTEMSHVVAASIGTVNRAIVERGHVHFTAPPRVLQGRKCLRRRTMDIPESPPFDPAPKPRLRAGRSGFWLAVATAALAIVLPAIAWLLVPTAEPEWASTPNALSAVFFALLIMAGAAPWFTAIFATVLGIVSLAKRERPIGWAIVAVSSLPIALLIRTLWSMASSGSG